MLGAYKTVEKEARDEYIVKKSRVISNIRPVTSQQEALDFINEISKKHWDATHNVYAYILRENCVERFSDDGEPQGTAGIPALDVLRKNGITDCCVVVTRYFGGIMLGAGGLVRAYSHSAAIATEKAGIITRDVCAVLKLTCDYDFYGKLSSLIPENGGKTDSVDFAEKVTAVFHLRKDSVKRFNDILTDASNGKYKTELISERYETVYD